MSLESKGRPSVAVVVAAEGETPVDEKVPSE